VPLGLCGNFSGLSGLRFYARVSGFSQNDFCHGVTILRRQGIDPHILSAFNFRNQAGAVLRDCRNQQPF
jgi:hypothetical protein